MEPERKEVYYTGLQDERARAFCRCQDLFYRDTVAILGSKGNSSIPRSNFRHDFRSRLSLRFCRSFQFVFTSKKKVLNDKMKIQDRHSVLDQVLLPNLDQTRFRIDGEDESVRATEGAPDLPPLAIWLQTEVSDDVQLADVEVLHHRRLLVVEGDFEDISI
jgi:hypothetical protein